MGEKKHSKGTAFGKAKLHELVGEIYEGDGCRFAEDGPRTTHKGLPKHPKYRDNHRQQQWRQQDYELDY
ncbi:MAG: hypothetical protein JKY71_03885 [Alphaproteobacteria bacterium]|nr:hypothetical protein [Alphaproteobacteria bacterium]